MKYEAYFRRFCKIHGYIGEYKHNSETDEYDVIISKGGDNAGAFLEKSEYEDLTQGKLRGILKVLHKGFQEEFNK